MTTTQIQEYSATEAALAGLAEKYKGVVYDVTKKEEMAAAKAARSEIRGYRTALEAKRVEIKAPALERCRLIDAEAKRITAALEALEEPIVAQIKIEEDRIAAEKEAAEAALRARVEAIQERMRAMRELPMASFHSTIEQLQEYIKALESQPIDEESFGDFVEDATHLKAQTLITLNANLEGKKAAAAEAERVKAEREELERQQAAQREADAARARAIEEAERESRAKIEAAEREARERIEAAEREAKAKREEAERIERQAREAKEAEERKLREAEEARQREIQRQENLKLDGREMLRKFAETYADSDEFKGVVKAINQYFDGMAKAA